MKIKDITRKFLSTSILNDISERKHKHMTKSGAPPDKLGDLHCLLPIEFHAVTSRIDF